MKKIEPPRNDLDSRTTRPIGVKPMGLAHLGVPIFGQPVFCMSCGHQDGFVTVGLPPGVFYLCGFEAPCGCECEKKFGVPPEMITKRDDLDLEMVH